MLKLIKYSIYIFIAPLGIGLILVDYSFFIIFFGAFIVGSVIIYPFKRKLAESSSQGIVILLIVLSVGLGYIAYFPTMDKEIGSGTGTLAVKKYKLTINPIKKAEGNFEIKEQVLLNCQKVNAICNRDSLITYSKDTVTSYNRGLFFKEVKINPLNINSNGEVKIFKSKKESLSFRLCNFKCPESTIRIINFDIGSFYKAKYSDVKTHKYFNNQEIRWSSNSIDDGVVFSYFPAPFNYFSGILKPIAGITGIGEYLIAILSFVTGTIIGPLIIEYLKQRLQDIFEVKEQVST